MAISKEVVRELLKDYKNPEDLLGENGILKELTKALVESALSAELTDHLGYQKHENGEKEHTNRRNGTSEKTVRSDQGAIGLEVPRDREATFEPKVVAKHQREIPDAWASSLRSERPAPDAWECVPRIGTMPLRYTSEASSNPSGLRPAPGIQ